MAVANDLKNGVTFLFEGHPYKVLKFNFQKIGRGGATVRVHVKDLETGSATEKTFASGNKIDEIQTSKKSLQYLYKDETSAYFMDAQNFDQIEVPLKVLGDDIYYIKEGESVNVLFWDDKALSVDIAPKVTLKVDETPPGVKGNSATNIFKPATLENGLKTKVPLFIKKGDAIKIDTRSGEYVERVN